MELGPVFVVGMNGSGTTMLADSLGRHRNLYMFKLEAKVLPYFLHRVGMYGDLTRLDAKRRLADDIGRTKPFWHVNGQRPLVVSDDRLSQNGYCGVVHGVFGELAAREGKDRWGEKSPMNLPHIFALGTAFPDAKFVHIIRDGREAAQSFHRRYGSHPVHTIYRWKRLVALGREQGKKLGYERYVESFYEALTEDPERELKRLCKFLGLTYSDDLLESSMRMIDPGVAGQHRTIIENSDKWKTYFDASTIAALERVAGRTLAELGYSPTDTRGDVQPSSLSLWIWRIRDSFVRTIVFFKSYGWRGLPVFVRVVRAAIMQRQVTRF